MRATSGDCAAPTSTGPPAPLSISTTRRRISARMIFSPRTASATSKACTCSVLISNASTSPTATPSTKDGLPESCEISPEKLPGPCSTTGKSSPRASRPVMRMRPESTRYMPMLLLPACTMHVPFAKRRGVPKRAMRAISCGVRTGNICAWRASRVGEAGWLILVGEVRQTKPEDGKAVRSVTRGSIVRALDRSEASARLCHKIQRRFVLHLASSPTARTRRCWQPERGRCKVLSHVSSTAIIGISGSTRRGSYNSALLRAAASSMPQGATLHIASIASIPLYNGDDEAAHGIPEAVAQLKDAIAQADGLLLVSPEYNNSLPGVAKNAIDWLSRPAADIARVFGGKPVAIAGASPGGFGTVLSQNAWLPVFKTLGADLWSGGRLLVSRAGSVIDANGEIQDARTRESVRDFVAGFVTYVSERKREDVNARR